MNATFESHSNVVVPFGGKGRDFLAFAMGVVTSQRDELIREHRLAELAEQRTEARAFARRPDPKGEQS